MADTRQISTAERGFGIGFKSERARDKSDANRQIEGLTQNDRILAALDRQNELTERQNELLGYIAEALHRQELRETKRH